MGWNPIKDIKRGISDVVDLGRDIAQVARDPGEAIARLNDPNKNNREDSALRNADQAIVDDINKKKKEEADVFAASEEARMSQGRKRGKVSTMLSGGQGVQGAAPSLRRSLIGY